MKKLILSIFTFTSLAVSATGVEITASDLKLTAGNEWYMKVTGGKSIDDFDTTGTSVSWDLTSFEASLVNDTLKAEAATISDNGATVKISSNYVSETHYQVTGSDILMTAIYANNTDYPFGNGASSGFAHSGTSIWNSATTIPSPFGNIPGSLSGKTVAEGTVTTSFGTFGALLVKETFSVPGVYTETFYFWETKEYGRIAILRADDFMVMTQNNFNVITSSGNVSASNLEIFPNPATNNFTIKANALENVKVYDAIGNLVFNENSYTASSVIVDTSVLKAGVYFVQATSNGAISTSRVLVK